MINSIIFFHLIGDIIKINCWVLGNIMISKVDTKSFIFFQIEWSFVFVVLSYFFIGKYGFIGVSISYFITYIIHFSLLNIYFRRLLWINKTKKENSFYFLNIPYFNQKIKKNSKKGSVFIACLTAMITLIILYVYSGGYSNGQLQGIRYVSEKFLEQYIFYPPVIAFLVYLFSRYNPK